VSITVVPTNVIVLQPPVSNGHAYTTRENTTLTVAAPGVLATDTPAGTGLTAVLTTGPAHGTLMLNADGSFIYTPAANYTGTDSFSYQAAEGMTLGNVAVVQLTITPTSLRLIPDTRYYNYVRRRRSIDPARFDTWHPQIGAMIGMEIAGIPTRPTILVPANHHFNAAADRKLFDENAASFDAKQPILGALFQLESPWNGQTDLLPDTAYYSEQKALYEANPAEYQRINVYLGAIFAIEDFVQEGGTLAPVAPASASAIAARAGSANPPAEANPARGKTGDAGTV
jgi:hypothetical protein